MTGGVLPGACGVVVAISWRVAAWRLLLAAQVNPCASAVVVIAAMVISTASVT